MTMLENIEPTETSADAPVNMNAAWCSRARARYSSAICLTAAAAFPMRLSEATNGGSTRGSCAGILRELLAKPFQIYKEESRLFCAFALFYQLDYEAKRANKKLYLCAVECRCGLCFSEWQTSLLSKPYGSFSD